MAQEGLEHEYELACEHQHSCIVLLANKRFKAAMKAIRAPFVSGFTSNLPSNLVENTSI